VKCHVFYDEVKLLQVPVLYDNSVFRKYNFRFSDIFIYSLRHIQGTLWKLSQLN
jgi:hypothetical protein